MLASLMDMVVSKVRYFLSLFSILFAANTVSASPLEFEGELEVYKWLELKSFPDMKIPVYKSAGTSGPRVLFVHGNSSSARTFHRQYSSQMGKNYQLFFIDLPGHGLASKVDSNRAMPMLEGDHLPAGFAEYQEGLIEALEVAANDSEIMAEVLVGWSLGGHLAIKAFALDKLPEVKKLFIYGSAPTNISSPLSNKPFVSYSYFEEWVFPLLPSIGLGLNIKPSLRKGTLVQFDSRLEDRLPLVYTPWELRGAENRGSLYVRSFFSDQTLLQYPVPNFALVDAFERSDERFRLSLGVSALELLPEDRETAVDELDALLTINQSELSLAVVVGEKDKFINTAYLQELRADGYLENLWDDEIKIIPQTGHAPHLEDPEAFNTLLQHFIDEAP